MRNHYFLSIDQGTTSSRALIFDQNAKVVAQSQRELTQCFPQDGWVEQDPSELWEATLSCIQTAHLQSGLTASDLCAVGITNQRETTLVWERATGRPIYPAIVWQDQRTSERCQEYAADTQTQAEVSERTGLVIDAYFSATKMAWILDHVTGARARAEQGELAFGTVDTFLLWQLTGGVVHATDATNASRTLLYDIHKGQWDPSLCELFSVPMSLLPEVKDSAASFGRMQAKILGAEVPITGVLGDQQAALVGQGCFGSGDMKSTYGTGCFMMMNTGERVVHSRHRLLSTIAYQLSGKRTYAIEGSIFSAGSSIKWLRDGLGIISSAEETAMLAASVASNGGVYLVPGFTGLGAPHWCSQARGMLTGLRPNTTRDHIARATLEAVGYQSRDLLLAIQHDFTDPVTRVKVDGGMTTNAWLMQWLADILDTPVERAEMVESTALGAMIMAALGCGYLTDLRNASDLRGESTTFSSSMPAATRDQLYSGWKLALQKTLS